MSGSSRYGVVVGAVLCFGLMTSALGAQGMIGPSLADAKKALATTEAVAKKLDVGLSCAIVDSRGALVALTRMDNAGYVTADVAVGKARASAAFGAPSGGLTRIGELGLGSVIEGGEMLFLQGAVPIMKDGQSLGALGCSGATAQQDEDAATAGVKAIQ